MNAYVYQAALLCEDCAKHVMYGDRLFLSYFVDRDDSDSWPQGPIADGGGEADSPQHCDYCEEFLQNPLTTDGVAYVQDLFRKHREGSTWHGAIVKEWADFYGVKEKDA